MALWPRNTTAFAARVLSVSVQNVPGTPLAALRKAA